MSSHNSQLRCRSVVWTQLCSFPFPSLVPSRPPPCDRRITKHTHVSRPRYTNTHTHTQIAPTTHHHHHHPILATSLHAKQLLKIECHAPLSPRGYTTVTSRLPRFAGSCVQVIAPRSNGMPGKDYKAYLSRALRSIAGPLDSATRRAVPDVALAVAVATALAIAVPAVGSSGRDSGE